ncbi:MAG TPA: hypothetical protein PLO67_04855, partial [Saprospiraceae bacterium]|nr:hypothetical protein [Saprospiraceae bacterium]
MALFAWNNNECRFVFLSGPVRSTRENAQKRVVERTGPDRKTNRHLLLFETKKLGMTHILLLQKNLTSVFHRRRNTR